MASNAAAWQSSKAARMLAPEHILIKSSVLARWGIPTNYALDQISQMLTGFQLEDGMRSVRYRTDHEFRKGHADSHFKFRS